MTTVVVMPVVMMSFDLPTRVSTAAPIPISTTMPQGRNGKIRRYTRHSPKLSSVADILDIAAVTLSWWPSRNTKIVAATAHMPPRSWSSRDPKRVATMI